MGEIVKQGTVLGPDLCCIATDQINNIGENQEKSVGEEIVGTLVFVDDVMSAGTAEKPYHVIYRLHMSIQAMTMSLASRTEALLA